MESQELDEDKGVGVWCPACFGNHIQVMVELKDYYTIDWMSDGVIACSLDDSYPSEDGPSYYCNDCGDSWPIDTFTWDLEYN